MRNVPNDNRTPLLLGSYYIFKIIPLLIGGMSIYLGYRLFILGVSGEASLSIHSKTVSGQLLNAAPGLFFAIGGIVAVLVTVWKGVDIAFTDDREPPVKKKVRSVSAGGGGGLLRRKWIVRSPR